MILIHIIYIYKIFTSEIFVKKIDATIAKSLLKSTQIFLPLYTHIYKNVKQISGYT